MGGISTVHRQPGSYSARPTVASSSRTTSARPCVNLRTSSGVAKRRACNRGIDPFWPTTERAGAYGPSSARRIVPHATVHRRPCQVGMAVVPRTLLDHVDQDVGKARRRGWALSVTVRHRLGEQVTGPIHCLLPAAVELLGTVLGGRAPVPVVFRAPIHRIPGGSLG